MRAKFGVRIAEAYRRIKHSVELLTHEQMAGRGLFLVGGVIDPLHHIVGEGAGRSHVVGILKGLDRLGRLPAERAVEVLNLKKAHGSQDVLDANHPVALGAARHQDTQRRG